MKIKKIIASIVIVGILSTMGFSAIADTINIGESTCEDIIITSSKENFGEILDSENYYPNDYVRQIYLTGDVNIDGKVNILDFLTLQSIVQNKIDVSSCNLIGDVGDNFALAGDINDDGYYSAIDLVLLKRQILGKSEIEVLTSNYDVLEFSGQIENVDKNRITFSKDIYDFIKNITLYATEDTKICNIGSMEDLNYTPYGVYVEYNKYNGEILSLTRIIVEPTGIAKPVIYLYPTEETKVNVSLDFNGDLTCTYPNYENGWSIIAEPDGTLYDKNGNEYYCLYWEGNSNIEWDLSKGFVVKGEDTADFLREKLLYMGLTPKEAQEFIIYWLPKMENNPYNLITFQDDIYTENAKLDITPQPDSLLRIFMTYKPLETPIEVQEQELSTFDRSGFVAIEWGGAELK